MTMTGRLVSLRLTAEEDELLDAFRRAHADPPGRSTALHRLVSNGLSKFRDHDAVMHARVAPSLPPHPKKRSRKSKSEAGLNVSTSMEAAQ
jgi:hypothetical protein